MKERETKRSGTEITLMIISGLFWVSIIAGSYGYAFHQIHDYENQVALVLPR